jgi:hypothetical protein
MEEVKLPKTAALRAAKKRKKHLPPQMSATDTSNWDNRIVSAPIIDFDKKKRSTRGVVFIRNDTKVEGALTPNQAKKLDKQVGHKKTSK